jgi:hypothetical protein
MTDTAEQRGEVDLPAAPPCSAWTTAQHVDPVGSAGRYEGFLLVEQPLPWPADVSEIADLVAVAKVARDANLRFQVVVDAAWRPPFTVADESVYERQAPARPPADASASAGHRRVICYRLPGWVAGGSDQFGWTRPLARSELVVAPGDLGEAATRLAGGPPPAVLAAVPDPRAVAGQATTPPGAVSAGPAPGEPAPGEPAPGEPTFGLPATGAAGDLVDVLVCTHGRRDMCCGARGMDLIGDLLDDPLAVGAGSVRLWRTSHTGGHRFAPTAVVLPSATLWAWADVHLLQQVVANAGPVVDVVGRYRGNACLGSPRHQALERAVLAQVGWPLLTSRRRTSDLPDGRVGLESQGLGTWDAAVREGRRVPQPECRTDPRLASKFNVEWVVEDLRQVAPAPAESPQTSADAH